MSKNLNIKNKQNWNILGEKRFDIDTPEIEKLTQSSEGNKRKVIVPVGKKKLEKLLVFYYMKKWYPKYVNKLLEENDKNKEEEDDDSQDTVLKSLSGREHNLEADIQKYVLPKMDTKLVDQERKLDNVIISLMTKEINMKSSVGEIDSNILPAAEGVDKENVDSADDKRILKGTTTPLLKKYFDNNSKVDDSNKKLTCKEGLKCVVSELVTLLDKTYLKSNQLQQGEARDSNGYGRGGIDPYATIGHASIQHVSEHHEQQDVDDHERHYVNHEGHYVNDFYHHEDSHQPHFEHSPEHHDNKVLDESAELEHMIHSIPDLHAVNFNDNIHNNVPHEFQRIYHQEELEKQREKEEKKETERLHQIEIQRLREEERLRHEEEQRHREKEEKEQKFHKEMHRISDHHEGEHGHHNGHRHKEHGLGHNLHELEFIHQIGLHSDHGWHHDFYHYHRDHHHHDGEKMHDEIHHDNLDHHFHHDRQRDGEFNDGVAPKSTQNRAVAVSGEARAIDVYKPYEHHDNSNEEQVNFHPEEHHDHHHGHAKKHNTQHKRLKHVYEHVHHYENPIVHIEHNDEYDESPGEDFHNTLEMISNQGSHVHVHEHPHEEIEDDDTLPIPGVVHEGPISTASVFSDHFKGPGIRDQPDVHYEEEMDANHYRKRRSTKTVEVTKKRKVLSKRGDPYATIGHYPENHLDIGELEHEEIESSHEEDFGGGYGWDLFHHHNHHHHCGVSGIGFGGNYESVYGGYGGHHGSHGSGYGDHGGGGYGGSHCEHIVHHMNHHLRHFTEDEEEKKEEGDYDHVDHGHHVHQPNPEPYHFNDHIHPAIPHIYEQLEHEPWVYHGHGHHHEHQHYKHHHDNQDPKHESHHHHPEPEAEHQDDHDHDENHVVHVNVHYPWLHKRDRTKREDSLNTPLVHTSLQRLNMSSTILTRGIDVNPKLREKRWHRGHHRYHYRHHYFDDDAGDSEGGDGHDVARLSYLTEKYGHDMTHDIDKGTHEVEAVGDEIERQVNRQIDDVTEEGYDVEAPDYDSHGHFYPTIHEPDVENDVERTFPQLTQRQLIEMVERDRYRHSYDVPTRHTHIHYDKDDDDDR
ncbi:sarcoplasmic reticulum histidine-rich calcium-binding protein-like isoform X2 [Hydractinia symbiolongicarpus]|nr:sarcoplasmic reticulum histidine-rich calcium-binding protein-like isoform X2 [Hydractinia symbiolongicarpus]